MDSEDRAASQLVNLVKEIVSQEMEKRDTTILCQVEEQVDDFHYNLTIFPDKSSVVRNVPNMTVFKLRQGDFVYVYKINNQLSNCFICFKLGILSKDE